MSVAFSNHMEQLATNSWLAMWGNVKHAKQEHYMVALFPKAGHQRAAWQYMYNLPVNHKALYNRIDYPRAGLLRLLKSLYSRTACVGGDMIPSTTPTCCLCNDIGDKTRNSLTTTPSPIMYNWAVEWMIRNLTHASVGAVEDLKSRHGWKPWHAMPGRGAVGVPPPSIYLFCLYERELPSPS